MDLDRVVGRAFDELETLLADLKTVKTRVPGNERPWCYACLRPVSGQAVTVSSRTYHLAHFACLICGSSHAVHQFHHLVAGMPVCEACMERTLLPHFTRHYRKQRIDDPNPSCECSMCQHLACSPLPRSRLSTQHAPTPHKINFYREVWNRCKVCTQVMHGERIAVAGRVMHEACLQCSRCGIALKHAPYYDEPEFGVRCEACQPPPLGDCKACGRTVFAGCTVNGIVYHTDHLSCHFCGKQLPANDPTSFKEFRGELVCTHYCWGKIPQDVKRRYAREKADTEH